MERERLSVNVVSKKRLSVNIVSNLVSYGISVILSFFLTPFLVNNLGKEIYSFYGIANDFVNYITVISIALNSMASKYITVEYLRGNEKKAKQYFSSIFFSNVILCAILTPILIVIVLNLKYILTISNDYYTNVQILFTLVFLSMIIRLVSSVFGSSTYATNRMDLNAYVDIGKSVLRLCLYLLLFYIFKPSIMYVGIVLFILEMYYTVAIVALSKKLMPSMIISRSFFDYRLVVSTLKIGIWNSLNNLGDLLLSSSAVIMANILVNESAGGSISIIKTLPSLVSGVVSAMNGVFMPRVANAYAKDDKKLLVGEVNLGQRIMGCIVTPIIVLLVVFSSDFYELWVPGNNTALLSNLSTIDISRMAIIGAVWPVANLNVVLDKVKIPSLLVILSGFLNVVSMTILVKFTSIGVYAMPITTLVLTVAFYGIFIPIYPCKLLGVSKKSFIQPIFLMLVTFLISFLVVKSIHGLFYVNSWKDFIIWGGLCAIVCYAISIVVFWNKQLLKKIGKGR